MLQPLNALLKNLSVSLKLMMGYGVVFVLMLLMALLSASGIGEVVKRSEQVSSLDKLDLQVYKLTEAQTAYLAKGDESTLNQLRQELAELQRRETLLAEQLTAPADQEAIAAQRQQTAAYQETLEQLVPVYAARARAHQTLERYGAATIGMFNNAEQSIMQDSVSDNALRLAERDLIANLVKQTLEARLVVLNFILNNLKSHEQASVEAVTAVLQNVTKAQAQLSYHPRLSESLHAIKEEFKHYQNTLSRYSQAVDQAFKLDREMAEHIASITELSHAQSQAQLEQRSAQVASTYQTLGLGTILALVIGLLAATLISRQIVHPLTQMVAVSETIAAGDLSAEITVDRKDEIGHLQHSMQRMTQGLRELIGNIHLSVRQIAHAAQDLSSVTEQTSAGVSSQKTETDQVATAMNEMVATVQEVARNAEHASSSANAADRQSHEGELAIQEAIKQMDSLAQEVVRSNNAVQSLNQESQKIGSVLDVIKAVAAQTNLLALNAAIEAARAGDAGRGFAVVADEVRGLAQHTQKSTEEIEALIVSLQRESQQASTLMQNSQQLTSSTLELSREAGVRLAAIVQSVSHIQAMNQQIAAAAEQQGAVAEEINRSVVSVRDVSEQTSEASKQTASSSVELARLGNALEQLVSRFRT